MRILIVSVIYLEPEWKATRDCIAINQNVCEMLGHTVNLIEVDRKGWGSLSEAMNRGAKEGEAERYDYIWFVTNVTFNQDALANMLVYAENSSFVAIHPAFNSDHAHLRPIPGGSFTLEVPFIEFTAPLVRADVFAAFPLDERMPYWGMDLDWSYRVMQAGNKLGCCHEVVLGHEYIRNNVKAKRHPITQKRWNARKRTDDGTRRRLIKLYGKDWKKVLKYTG